MVPRYAKVDACMADNTRVSVSESPTDIGVALEVRQAEVFRCGFVVLTLYCVALTVDSTQHSPQGRCNDDVRHQIPQGKAVAEDVSRRVVSPI